MTAKDAIRQSFKVSEFVFNSFLEDLSDADLLLRPAPKANHIAWQLGHLIAAENRFLKAAGGTPIELPAGFEDKHSPETSHVDPPQGFLTKAEYLDMFKQVRAATHAALENMADADLDRPMTGNLAKMCPTAGALLLLCANHVGMHAGQFTVVRRILGKPVKF